jgi:hypothetical protein
MVGRLNLLVLSSPFVHPRVTNAEGTTNVNRYAWMLRSPPERLYSLHTVATSIFNGMTLSHIQY